MKIPKADSNPGVELRYNTSLPTELLSCMHSLHSYRVYSDIVIGWLIAVNTEGGKEYFIPNKFKNS